MPLVSNFDLVFYNAIEELCEKFRSIALLSSQVTDDKFRNWICMEVLSNSVTYIETGSDFHYYYILEAQSTLCVWTMQLTVLSYVSTIIPLECSSISASSYQCQVPDKVDKIS